MDGWRREWRVAGLALICGLVWTVGSHAEPPGRVGFFDLQKVVSRTEIEREARSEFVSKLEELQRELEAREREINRLREQLTLEGATLSPEARKERESGIEQKFQALSQDKERYQKELLTLDRSSRAWIKWVVSKAAKEVGREGGYAAILDRKGAGLYYVQEELDLTNAIIQRIKRRIKEKKGAGPALSTPPVDAPPVTGEPPAPDLPE